MFKMLNKIIWLLEKLPVLKSYNNWMTYCSLNITIPAVSSPPQICPVSRHPRPALPSLLPPATRYRRYG